MDGNGVKVIRETLKLTQEAFAQRIGVSRRSVIDWENGKAQISIAMQAKVSAANLVEHISDTDALTMENAPQCFVQVGTGKNVRFRWTLKHPRWPWGPGSPYKRRQEWLAARKAGHDPDWQSHLRIEVPSATFADLQKHVPPSVENALAQLVKAGVSDWEARSHLNDLGHNLPMPQMGSISAALLASGGTMTADQMQAAGIQLNYAKHSAPAAIAAPTPESLAMQKALDDAFNFSLPTPNSEK